jgi:hypothetical protein
MIRSSMDFRKIGRRFSDLKLSVIGYKTGNEPNWLRLERLAFLQAMVEESDERALAAIAGEIQRHPKAAREARERLAPSISCYDADRAVRLIDAAMDGVSVRSIRSEYVDLFTQEARLGRMPLREAFAEMESREPELKRIRQQFEKGRTTVKASVDERTADSTSYAAHVMLREAQREVGQIIGPQSDHFDPLLRSYLLRNIAYSWLRMISGDRPHVDPDASYFSRFDTIDLNSHYGRNI